MRGILVIKSRTSVCPPVQTVGVEVGRQDSLWDGSVTANFLGWKLRGSVAFANPRFSVFLAGNHISDEQRDKESIKSRKKHERRGDEI